MLQTHSQPHPLLLSQSMHMVQKKAATFTEMQRSSLKEEDWNTEKQPRSCLSFRPCSMGPNVLSFHKVCGSSPSIFATADRRNTTEYAVGYEEGFDS
mmetsp:Transcript_8815/g.54230  ORF Transcript_8815/g.54230 Transcript_8815/m.54230 type:complete len:97 (+) Transcript_8815:6125-6415(+)